MSPLDLFLYVAAVMSGITIGLGLGLALCAAGLLGFTIALIRFAPGEGK